MRRVKQSWAEDPDADSRGRLLEANAVIELLENSLRDPEFRFGPGGYQGVGLQDFFVESGVLTEADVREDLGL